MENTTMEPTSVYRAAIEYLAESRGLCVEELAERVHEADPVYTREEILAGPGAGFGIPLEAALGGMTEPERVLITGAFARTFLSLRREGSSLSPREEVLERLRAAQERGIPDITAGP